MGDLPISEHSLQDLLPDSLTSSFCVSIPKSAQVWVVTGMLVHYLESFTDSVVIRDGYDPIGLIGGIDIIDRLVKNPSSDFFYNTNVEDVLDKTIIIITKETKLKELVYQWKLTGRAFAIIDNELQDYSAISTRKILEIGSHCKTNLSISTLPKKKIVTFRKDDVIGDIINAMLENKTRRLLLENSSQYINDRIIIEKIVEDLNYLQDIDNFLDITADTFKLGDAKVVSEDLTIPEVSKLLFEIHHPYFIYENQVISPWDICLALLSDNLTQYD